MAEEQQKMTCQQAVQVLDSAVSQMSLPRKDHAILVTALQLLADETAPKPDEKKPAAKKPTASK